ncbi:hypothetical protein BJV78DRAFT_1286036 [Lactifluus subvellereus]|nr:hypothetical protein BJV78DRAFT_1286036 [Lactifluus subvellereus]
MGNCLSIISCGTVSTVPSHPAPRAENPVSQTSGSEISPNPFPLGDNGTPAREAVVRDDGTIASPLPGPALVESVRTPHQSSETISTPNPSPPPPHRSMALVHSLSVGHATMTTTSWRPQLGSITGALITEEPACAGPLPMTARSKSAYPSFQSGKRAPSSSQKEMGVAESGSGYAARRPRDATIGASPNNYLQSLSGTSHISTKADNSRPTLTSTVREVLSNNFRFSILVVGKSGSGKSSLMNSIFKVDMAAAQVNGNSDIRAGFCPSDNRYLKIHEYSEFEPGDSQNLQIIRNFITDRTDAHLPASERLHAIWICVPASDLIDGNLGDGVEEILCMQKVPVVPVFTKFDLLVSQVLLDIADGDPRYHEHAKARAQDMCEESCRRLLRKDSKDVPAEIVSRKPEFGDLIDKLIVTTRQVLAEPRAVVTPPKAQKAKLRLPSPVLLAWSVAQRASHNVIIEASIEVGRSRYWCDLGSSPHLRDEHVKNCLNIIHADIVDVWNLRDSNQYLSSETFKAKVRDLVQELTGIPTRIPSGSKPNSTPGTGVPMPSWVNDPYCGTNENVCCVIGYVVDLTVILYHVFRSSRDVSTHLVQSTITNFTRSGYKDEIHNNIREFVTTMPTRMHPERDVFMEKIIDLITSALQR